MEWKFTYRQLRSTLFDDFEEFIILENDADEQYQNPNGHTELKNRDYILVQTISLHQNVYTTQNYVHGVSSNMKDLAKTPLALIVFLMLWSETHRG